MYTGETTFVLSATKGNLNSEIIAAYQRNMAWAANNLKCWAHKVFHETVFWSCQPTLVLLAS